MNGEMAFNLYMTSRRMKGEGVVSQKISHIVSVTRRLYETL